MKKLFFIFSAALVFASCSNSGGNAEQRMKDSLDSVTKLKVESVEEAAEEAKDTIQQANDSLKNRIDSVADQTRDSLNK